MWKHSSIDAALDRGSGSIEREKQNLSNCPPWAEIKFRTLITQIFLVRIAVAQLPGWCWQTPTTSMRVTVVPLLFPAPETTSLKIISCLTRVISLVVVGLLWRCHSLVDEILLRCLLHSPTSLSPHPPNIS